MGYAIGGAFWGALLGACIGFIIGFWIFLAPPFFTGDIVLIGAVLGAVGGYFWGEEFVDFIKWLLSWLHWWV